MNKEEYNEYCDKVDQELEQKERLENPTAFPEGSFILTYILLVGALITAVLLLVRIF